MALSTTRPIKNGIVRLIRSQPDLKAALVGGIHQRLGPRRLKYPFCVYSEVSAPFIYDWGAEGDQGKVTIKALYDISFFALNSVEAENLDSLCNDLFSGPNAPEDLQAFVVGQTVIYCRRTVNMPTGPDRDDEGRRVVQFGGTYAIWTVHAVPKPVAVP